MDGHNDKAASACKVYATQQVWCMQYSRKQVLHKMLRKKFGGFFGNSLSLDVTSDNTETQKTETLIIKVLLYFESI